jgi:hypothetical protein
MSKKSDEIWQQILNTEYPSIKDVIQLFEEFINLEKEHEILEIKLKETESNNNRFLDYLDKIAYLCNIGWYEGNFPIKELFDNIVSRNLNYYEIKSMMNKND